MSVSSSSSFEHLPPHLYPNYSRLWFEDGIGLRRFSEDLWGVHPWPVMLFAAAYLSLIPLLQWAVRDLPPMQVRYPLVAWNCFHCVVSLLAIVRAAPDVAHSLTSIGFRKSLVVMPPLEHVDVQLFWGIVYGWCKLIELGDTVFLVLRKKPATLLHTFHHCTTLVVTCYASQHEEHRAFFRWFVYVNFFVHFWMYGYFALTTWGVRLPKRVPMALTLLQMTQMVFILYMLLEVFDMERSGLVRRRDIGFLRIGFVLASLNLLLFANYFYRAYVADAKRRSRSRHKDD